MGVSCLLNACLRDFLLGEAFNKKNKLGLSWGSTRLRQLAWSQPTESKPQIGLDLTFFFDFTESKFYSKLQTNPNQTIWNTT